MLRSLLFAVFLILAVIGARGQNKTDETNRKITDAMRNVYGGSEDAPFTAELKNWDNTNNPTSAKEIFADLVQWFEEISIDVKNRRINSDGSECTLRGQGWIEDARIYMQDRQMQPPEKNCATRTEHTEAKDRNRAFSLLERASKLFGEVGNNVVTKDPEIKKLWPVDMTDTEAHAFSGLEYEPERQKCTLDYATAVKKDKIWYIFAAVTSPTVRIVGRIRKRIVEHVHQNFSLPLQMNLSTKEQKRAGGDNPATGIFTTAYAEGVGAARISRVTEMQFEQNRALTAAQQANLLSIDQAKDALTTSNFAILILPLLMSFIPVALIADVSDVATFFYVLLTDVFSAVPFVIKGIELLQTGTTTTRNAETWLVGEIDGLQVAETWAAKCSPQSRFRRFGIIVIVLGISAIFMGILIEHVARKWMSRRRDKGEDPKPFGPALLHVDAYIPVGANHMPHVNYDDALAPNIMADFPPPPPPAAGPVQSRFSSLFSGLLRRRAPRQSENAWPRQSGLGEEELQNTWNLPGRGGAGSTTFSNIIGIMRRRYNAETPDREVEYEDGQS